MLALSHTLIGGAAGALIKGPSISFTAGVFLHFVADKVVHYLPRSLRNKKIFGFLDWTGSAILIYLLYRGDFGLGVVFGALGGLAVDVTLLPVKPIRESKLGAWHISRQTHTRNYWYILRDAAAILFGAILIWSFR